MSRLEGTEGREQITGSLGFHPCSSARYRAGESIGPVQGRRPGRRLPRRPSGRQAARPGTEGGGYRRRGEPGCAAGWSGGCQGGRPASSRLHQEPGPPPLLRARLPSARGCRLGTQAPRLGSGGAAAPAGSPGAPGGGLWKPRAAPPQPHPSSGCLPAWPPATGCGPGARVEGDAAASPGPRLLRPGDLGDKSLQHAACLQCESHPPRRLLQHQRSQTNK